MTEPTIICPSCQTEIRLTESLAAPLIETTKKQYEKLLADKEEQVKRRETTLRDREAALAKDRESIEEQVAQKLAAQRAGIVADEAKKARLALGADLDQKAKELAELQDVLKERDAKLGEAQKAEAEWRRKSRELDEAKRELELTVEKQVDEKLAVVRRQARQQAEEELKLKVLEKEHTIASMQRQIEELKRKAEQGSQQLQGEVQELELETILRTKFPSDTIEPVAKGEYGGDLLHLVVGPLSLLCGKILWESKRTKHWSDGWLTKLRDDQRAAQAEIAVIVSQALPKEVETFGCLEGVWVTAPRTVVPVAVALRHALIEVAQVRQAADGQQTKMEMVYQYLTGPQFRHRLSAIVEKFSELQDDLEKERRWMTRQWQKREQQVRAVIDSTQGMIGDLQGIAGKSLQEIDGLRLPALPPSEPPS